MLGKIQDFLLILYVVSLGFEYWDPFGLVGFVSISKLISIIYLLSLTLSYKKTIFLRFPTKLIYEIVLWLILFIVMNIINDTLSHAIDTPTISIFLNILMFCFITNHLIVRGNVLLKKILLFFLSISVLQFLLINAGVGVSFVDNRLYLFGENPNITGFNTSLALMLTLFLVFDNFLALSKKRFLLLFAIPIQLTLIFSTGSRGAIISTVLGIVLFVFLRKINIKKKILFCFLMTAFLFIIYELITQNEIISTRLYSLIENGDDSRMNIYYTVSKFAFDNPLFGFGATGYYQKITQYGTYKMTHNGFLDIYLYTGVIGLFFFSIFLYKLGRLCWYSNKEFNISISSVFFLMSLFNFAKSGGVISGKIFWFIFIIINSIYYINIYNNKYTNKLN